MTDDNHSTAYKSSLKGKPPVTTPANFAVNEVSKKYLIYEIPADPKEESLSNPQIPRVTADVVRMQKAHLFMLVYDNRNANSFKYTMDLYHHFHANYPKTPCLFVATKCDLDSFKRERNFNPETFCKSYSLPPPIPFKDKDDAGSLYLLTMERILETKRLPGTSLFKKISLLMVVFSVVMTGGYLTINHYNPSLDVQFDSLSKTINNFISSVRLSIPWKK